MDRRPSAALDLRSALLPAINAAADDDAQAAEDLPQTDDEAPVNSDSESVESASEGETDEDSSAKYSEYEDSEDKQYDPNEEDDEDDDANGGGGQNEAAEDDDDDDVEEEEEAAADPVDEPRPRRKRKRAQGAKALSEIRKLQRTTELLIPFQPFQRLVREIALDLKDELRFTGSAVLALQTAAEDYIIRLMTGAVICTVHAKRVKLEPRDLQLAQRLMDFDH